jgi:serine/threonine protein phosphatase PrpC
LPQLTALFADHQYLAKRHIISNAIGRNYNPNWIPWTFTLKPGDKLILASDGIETLHPKTVFQILLEGHPLHQLPKIFFERVMEANQKWQTTAAAIFTKPDNFTVVVYEHQ